MQEHLIAILIALLPASLAYWAKLRAESLACRRLVVSYLLEIRHTLVCTSITADKLFNGFNSSSEKLLENLLEKYSQVDDSNTIEVLDVLKPLAYQMFKETVSGVVPSFSDEFLAEFNAALKELRKEQPLLAFQLVGWEKEQAYLRIKQNYANQFSSLEELNGAPPLKAFVKENLNEDQDKSLLEVVRLLDGLISKVAWSCGLITYAKISYFLYKRPVTSFTANESDFLEEMEPIMIKIDALIVEHLNANSASENKDI